MIGLGEVAAAMSAASTAEVADEELVFFLRFFFFFLEEVVSIGVAVDVSCNDVAVIGRLPISVGSGSGDCRDSWLLVDAIMVLVCCLSEQKMVTCSVKFYRIVPTILL